jgi:hypothetical protein
MTTMDAYQDDPRRFVTPEQHALLAGMDAAGALPLPAGPAVNRLYLRGLVERSQRTDRLTGRRSYWLNPAGRSVLGALDGRST